MDQITWMKQKNAIHPRRKERKNGLDNVDETEKHYLSP